MNTKRRFVVRRSWANVVCCGVLLTCWAKVAVGGEALLSVSFAKDKWDPSAWVIAHNPTVPHPGKWVQRETCIENETPADPAKKSSLNDTMTTMVYGKKFSGDYTIAATFEIGAGAAPGIVLAQDWAPDDKG